MINKFVLTLCIVILSLSSIPLQAKSPVTANTKIRIVAEGNESIAVLNNSQTTQDFIKQLPLILTLDNYGKIEKVSTLPRKLSIVGAPSGYTPHTGDIAYYAPWGNIAIFRRNFSYSNGLIKLGRVEKGIELINTSKQIKVRIEVVK